jgi:TonB family protein
MKTKVLFGAFCLLVSISVCAGNKKPTTSKITLNGQEKTVYVMTSDGGEATVTTTTSSSKGKKVSSTTITKQSKGNAASVLTSDGESLIDIDLSNLKSDLPKLTAEEMPEYPGGMSAMMNFIMDNIKYPEDAKKAGKDGRVICSFIIDKEGKVTEPHVVQSSGTQSLDEEAVRLVSLMPNWKPGKDKGEPVSVLYTIPVLFKLK